MKNRFELWHCALDELSAACAVSTTFDVNTVRGRMKHEGDAFFDIALPKFGKDFERALAHSAVVEGLFVGWAKDASVTPFTEVHVSSRVTSFLQSLPPHSDIAAALEAYDGEQSFPRKWDEVRGCFSDELATRALPSFLGGFLRLVFDPATGLLIHTDPESDDGSFDLQVDAVRAIRQLTLMFGKVEQECSPARKSAALKQYVETDRQIEEALERLTSRPDFFNRDILPLKKTFMTVFGDVFTRLDQLIFDHELVPRHGPGATADKKKGNQKFRQVEWTERLEGLFPYGEYVLPNWRHAYALGDVHWRSPEDERPTKVTLVPKTASTPRVIAEEPTCMQWLQQMLGRMTTHLSESARIHPNSRENHAFGFVGFSEQWPNQAMAQIGSEDGSLATLDLSEASDRVPNWLVEELLEPWPHVNEAFQVTRSLRADVPEQGVITLRKYASMGSALTFPVEAIVFATVVLAAMSEFDGKPGSWATIKSYRDRVRVYGDDIIVPTTHAVTVMRSLEFYGFKVNSAKSFWTGGFRESCGKEYYRGQDVSIVKFRRMLPQSLRDVDEIISTVSTRNLLFQAGYKDLVAMVDDVLEVALEGHFPYVSPTSPVLGRFAPNGLYEVQGIDGKLHAPFVRGYVESSKSPKNGLDGWQALRKCITLDYGEESPIEETHLARSGRPRASRIKLVDGRPF